MKKRNLIILLLMPFVISLLGLTAINLTFNIFENDILSIEWDYEDVEGFKVDEEGQYLLTAKAISDTNYPSKGNELIWTLKNRDTNDEEEHARILQESGKYYLKAISEGEVIITCSNYKGNITKSMIGVIYQTGLVVINPLISGSQNNVNETIHYGEYDLVNNQKVSASIEYKLNVVPSSLASTIEVTSYSSDTIDVNLNTTNLLLTVDIKKEGDAYLTLESSSSQIKSYTTSFNIVDDGVNVYTYDDLLYCTNRSENGEIMVLRKSFESVSNTYKLNSNGNLIINSNKPVKRSNNIELFGNYDVNKDTYSFISENEIYSFTTTYNHEFINQWNEFARSSGGKYQTITSTINAGLHVQKDVYGNGYTINLHNLTYPYAYSTVNVDGTSYIVPKLREDNLFRGPLPFYTLGDPNGLPLVSAYGQDNIGMYVEGNNITIDDLVLKNCDFGNNLANLDYTGTVIEVAGDNITLKNSRFSNGKNVLRSFSSDNVLVDNCILSYSRNFLITTGSNNLIKPSDEKMISYANQYGDISQGKMEDVFSKKGPVDLLLEQFIGENQDKEFMKQSLLKIQSSLDEDTSSLIDGTMTINDSYFYKSGVASIALESAFNGPFLYSGVPSALFDIYNQFDSNSSLLPYVATRVSGTSYPVKITLTGKTRFFDYKDIDKMDLSGLILQNIAAIANSLGQNVRDVTIDDIFPIRPILAAQSKDYACSSNGNTYLNVPIAYYGGGKNYSIVDSSTLNNQFDGTISAELIDYYLNLPSSSNLMTQLKYIMQKCVSIVTGFNAFRFTLYKGEAKEVNRAPSVELLKENAKGGI